MNINIPIQSQYICNFEGCKCKTVWFSTFSSHSGCLKLQLHVSSISLRLGCEPLVPLGLQNTKPCIQDVFVLSQDLNLCRHRDNFLSPTKEVYGHANVKDRDRKIISYSCCETTLYILRFLNAGSSPAPKFWVSF